MIKISKQNNSLIVEGIENVFYPNNGDNSYPLNSLIVVTDNSDMATFRSVATNDVLFSGLIQNITINGEAVTKDNIIQKFDAVSNSSTGGGGGTVDAYTKEEADNKFASKDELTNVQTVANDADTKVDALTTRVEGVETAMNDKQDLLVSGTNIKTINNQSILGEGNIEISDYYTKTEADNKFSTKDELTAVETVANNADAKADVATSRIEGVEATLGNKQDILVSGTNIKTINSQSILGEGNLEISGDVDLTNYYTKPEADGKFATITGFNEQAADISALQTAMDGKQPTLVSGTNIKTINNESLLGEGNIEVAKKTDIPSTDNLATKDELTAVETALNNKQDTLVSGENIKTINSESILGTGDIQINADAKIVNIGDAPFSNFYNLLSKAVSALNNGTDYTDTYSTMNETICKQYFDLFKTLKNGDLLSQYDTISDNIFKIECNPFFFEYNTSNNAFDILIKYLGNFNSTNFINYTRDIYVHFYFYKSSGEIGQVELKVYTKKAGPTLQKNDFKTINGESLIGEGNIEVSGVSEEQAQEIAKIPTLETELAQKANVSDVPTVQTGFQGTNKKYIYSEGNIDDNNKTVVSNIVNVNDNPDTVKLGIYEWGGSMGKVIKLPSATTTLAGVMSAADKTKLDSIPENIPTQTEVDNIAANVSALESDMANKQPTLVSGTNIKTINGNSILGEGNLVIEGGSSVDAYTKTESDAKYATKNELTAVETVANNADTKADAATSRVESVETSLGNKQDTLVSGTNIKTVNSQSILGEGNIEVTIPDATTATSGAMSAADKTKLDSISNEWTGTQSEYDALTTKDNNTIYYIAE